MHTTFTRLAVLWLASASSSICRVLCSQTYFVPIEKAERVENKGTCRDFVKELQTNRIDCKQLYCSVFLCMELIFLLVGFQWKRYLTFLARVESICQFLTVRLYMVAHFGATCIGISEIISNKHLYEGKFWTMLSMKCEL